MLILFPVIYGFADEGFRFKGGNVAAGKEAFEKLSCTQCHRVQGVELEKPKGKRRLDLVLASEVRYVKRYEDIIQAIVNPQHVITKQYAEMLANTGFGGDVQAFMPNLIEDMSAQQLIDLVTFLDSAYRESSDGYE